jgi:hypothetical protein
VSTFQTRAPAAALVSPPPPMSRTVVPAFVTSLVLVACAHESPPVRARVTAPIVAKTTAPPAASTAAPEEASLPPAAPIEECRPLETQLPEIAHEDFDVEVPEIEDATSEVMAPLYEKMALLLRGKATDHIRIGMWGDSNMTMDWITGHMRRVLQAKHGDGGHGFVALAKPWTWYHHMDVKHDLWLDSWINFAVSTAPAMDRLVGFAGIAAQSKHAGAVTWVETAPMGSPIGTTASRFDLYYLQRKGAGTFKIIVDGEKLQEVDAAGDAPKAEFLHFELPDAAHKIAFVATSNKPVRLFGVSMERGAPSFVVDSLGCGALSAQQMAEKEDQGINEQTLAHRKYDLVLDLVGTNMWDAAKLPSHWKTVLDTHRAATPNVPVIMMSPPDTAENMSAPHSDKRIVMVTDLKRKIAAENKVAFWDFRAAMGGDLSIVKFKRHKMAWGDLIHFNEKGASYMADRIVYAIWRDFMRWLAKHPQAGCTTGAPKVATLD